MSQKKPATVRHLKRYRGCRLYDPETGTYLAADDLRRLVLAGVRISVR
ncbi:polyhydroxyalkanoate synthesis regulator DNA-binding domain-containing protein [Methylobacterium durans]|nr:polyhydroxyalkanoate synthesis regulator DNA-binding domain-containing protein [Methylobacterium durans]MEA1834928.1 polyhydroxyalkanoate synthesis regulator DNA-binding domain-containing protein [Methylobacterium durans]